jgi:hypothetical protein
VSRATTDTMAADSSFPFHVKEHLVPSQHVREYARATAHSQDDVLYLAVKQYTPKDNPSPQPGDVTIIGAHANGFPKELYEPLWADLHAAAARDGRFRIRAIWVADVANQGYSGQANEQTMGDDPAWSDHARDLLHMVNVFRDQMPRPLVGIGHSFGANCLTHLSLLHPRLLTTLVLYDATITKFGFKDQGAGVSPARVSAFRRDLWPSRAEAAAAVRRSAFFKTWDPRVVDAWIKHGLRDTPTALYPDDGGRPGAPAVTLRTTKHQELFTFFRPLYPYMTADGRLGPVAPPDFDPTAHEAFDPHGPVRFPFYRAEGPAILRRLPEVRPSVLFVCGGASDLSTPAKRAQRLATCGAGAGGSGGVDRGRVREVVMEGRGHLFPMEVPGACAAHAADWLGAELTRWRDGEQREYDEWARAHTLREKSTMSAEWMRRMGPPPVGRGAKGKKEQDKAKL